MRVHIDLDDELVRRVDELTGPRGRTAFIRRAVEEALLRKARLSNLDSAVASIAEGGHPWDRDPAGWVHEQRFGDTRRTG